MTLSRRAFNSSDMAGGPGRASRFADCPESALNGGASGARGEDGAGLS